MAERPDHERVAGVGEVADQTEVVGRRGDRGADAGDAAAVLGRRSRPRS